MPRASPASILLHLLLTAWLGVALGGAAPRDSFQDDIGTRETEDSEEAGARNVMNPREKEPPHFLFWKKAPQKETEVRLGDSLVLECEVAGNPSPTIHWLKDGVKIRQPRDDLSLLTNNIPEEISPDSRSIRVSFTKSRLFIDCVTFKDLGRYSCIGETPYHPKITATSTVYLSDSEPDSDLIPSCSSPQKLRGRSGQSARVLMWTSGFAQTMGKDATLFCRGAGDPTPTVTWTNDEGDVLRNNNKYHIHRNGNLRIRHLTWDDMGRYSCESTNMFGKDSVDTFVYVMEPDYHK